jgi:[acyl-carrier-protein] S-malonyltransferase
MSIAWVFPGQGSQKLGMADSLLELPGARARFDLASQILGRDLLKVCSVSEGFKEEIFNLNDTRNTQPAMFVVESLLVDDLKRQGRGAAMVAGRVFLVSFKLNSSSLETSLPLQILKRSLPRI